MALVCAAAFGQTAEKKITLELPATRTEEVLRQLSKQSGRIMVADPSMRSEVLLISVKDAPLGEVMKQIAAVTDGMWTELAGELSLAPNAEVRSKEEAQAVNLRAAAITKMFAALPTDDPAATLLAQQSLTALAQIGPGQRVVFSSNPTSMQVEADGVTSDFVDYALSKTGTTSVQASAPNPSPGQRQLPPPSALNSRSNDPQPPQPATNDPSKVILAVSNMGQTMNAQMVIYNGRGVEMASDLVSGDAKVELPPAATLDAALTTPASSKVEMAKITRELWNSGFSHNQVRQSDLTPETAAAIKHPETNDPLSFYASDALLQRAKECGVQIVADLPDSVAYGRAESAAAFLSDAVANHDLKATVQDGWLIISPGLPVLSRIERANRPALATLMTAVSLTGHASLDDMAAYALAEGHAPMGILPEMRDASVPYLKNFVHDWANFQLEGDRFLYLALFGTLSPEQRIDLFNYRQVPARSLSSVGQVILNDIAFSSEGVIRVVNPSTRSDVGFAPPFVPGMPMRPHTMDPSLRMADRTYLREPTEVWASGVPADADFGLSVNARQGPSNGSLVFELHLKSQVVKDCVLTASPI